ncbi:histone chaperone ASF1-like [Micropterus dolomieu]|uniref:histone chaperone ASF1-like n=1 Tax=Micropterus dolomieu TaxID=147949 RepID=UPI001E8EE127|nr:histone chaperone ASF1-like [Micropterus dolomieu]
MSETVIPPQPNISMHPVGEVTWGSYRCQYQILVGSQNYNSTQSDSVRLLVTVPLWLLVSSAAGGGLLLLLLVLAVVVLVVRRRRRAKEPGIIIQLRTDQVGAVEDGDSDDHDYEEEFVQTQLIVRNSYEDEEEVDEDYVNVDPMDTTRTRTDQVGAVEDEDSDDHDYEEEFVQTQLGGRNSYEEEEEEEEEEEDEDDYVNVEPVDTMRKQTKQVEDEDIADNDYVEEEIADIYIVPTEVFVDVEDNREEQGDEESSADEDDYVNVT